jgi:hypothetical protein
MTLPISARSGLTAVDPVTKTGLGSEVQSSALAFAPESRSSSEAEAEMTEYLKKTGVVMGAL